MEVAAAIRGYCVLPSILPKNLRHYPGTKAGRRGWPCRQALPGARGSATYVDGRVAILRLTAEGEIQLARSFHANATERRRLREMVEQLTD